jgi:hypothetical protein
MTQEQINKLGEIQYLKGRLDELYKGFVPNDISKDNRIVDARISKYEEKFKKTDELAFWLYQMERQNRTFSKQKNKSKMKKLLQEIYEKVDDDQLKLTILNQINKY